jgi:hypothetical protein
MNTQKQKHKVFMTDIRSHGSPVLSAGVDLVKSYGLSEFEIADAAEGADLILYLESDYFGLSELPVAIRRVQAAPSAMHFMFSQTDWAFPILPGAYPSLSRSHPWAHSWSFLPTIESYNEARAEDGEKAELLFSFLGRIRTHPVRNKVKMLDKSGTPCLDVEEGPKRFPSFHYSKTYIELMKRSKFVLCPRGFGVSSIRIFETMSYGRAPVIISDHWQRPPGSPWDQFCVRIPESDVASIPVVLGRLEDNATSMGQKAKEIYDKNFAPDIFLDSLLTALLANFSNCTFTTDAILRRAYRAMGWREVKTLCHQGRSVVQNLLPTI